MTTAAAAGSAVALLRPSRPARRNEPTADPRFPEPPPPAFHCAAPAAPAGAFSIRRWPTLLPTARGTTRSTAGPDAAVHPATSSTADASDQHRADPVRPACIR